MRRTPSNTTTRPATGSGAVLMDPTATAPDGSGRLCGLVDEVAAVLERQTTEQLASCSTDELRHRVDLLRRLEGLAAAATATTVQALSRAGGVDEDGAPSVTSWLQRQTGRSARDAHRVARLASTLEELPVTAAALADGQLGAESADVVVRAARDGRLGSPDEVDRLLAPIATTSTPEDLRRYVRRREQQADAAAMVRDEHRQHQLRRFSLTRRDDGMWNVYGQLPAEMGERARTLLDVFDAPDPKGTEPGITRRPEQRMADAFDQAVQVALDHADLPDDGGVARPHVSVLVDLATFDADLTDPDDPDRPIGPHHERWKDLPPATTAWGGTMSPQATRRLCCDVGVSRIVTVGGSQVLDVGRETRKWSAPQRRAINARDRGCRGCGRPIAWTRIHHLQWWRHGGRTDVDNGIALCDHCHHLVHDDGWQVELNTVTAAVTWRSPDRRCSHVTHPRQPT